MKILFLLRSLEFGGAERQLITLAAGLKKRGHQIGVMLYYEQGPLLEELRALDIQPIPLGKRGRWDILRFLFNIVRTVRREKPDILHTYLTTSNVLGGLLKPVLGPCRLVWGVRDANTPVHQYDWMARWFARMECQLAGRADLIISNSELALKEMRARGFSIKRMIAIFNGIDTDKFAPSDKIRASTRRKLELADNDVVLGTVARIDVKKDFETLLAATALLKERYARFRLFIVGDGDTRYEKRLRSLCADLNLEDTVTWLGPRSDVPELYNAFDVACLSSTAEGFPNAVAEAMATGLACAVTDVGDAAIIVNDPRLIVNAGDSHGLAAAIEYGLKTSDLSGTRRDRIVALFNIATLLERTEVALENLP